MTNAKRHSWQDYTGNCLNLGCDAQEFAGADEPCPWKPPIAVNPQVPSNDRVSDFYLESTLRSISEARALDSQMISTSFLRMLCNELIERRAALGIDWQQIARERTVDIALADQRIERLQRELADVSHTKNALQGMLDAAEQHVRILQEQRASLEPGTGLLARMREINRLALNVENDPWANLTRIAELTCIESPAHVRRVVGHASGWQEQMDTCVCGEPWPCARASQPPSVGPLKLDNERQVFFYEQDHYYLSNFSAFSLVWSGRRFATSEAAYHWEKFGPAPEIGRAIELAPSAHEAFKLAERHKGLRRKDWDDVKVGIMSRILRAKADQHEYVRRKLLDTGDRELIENSWRDDYWGWGPKRDGQNMLGKLWMEIRAELRGSSQTKRADDPLAAVRWICPKCTTVNGIDDATCLGCRQARPSSGEGA